MRMKKRFWSMPLICSMMMLALAGTSYAEEQPQLISAPIETDETIDDSTDSETESAAETEEQRKELELEFNDADEASWAVQAIGLMKSQAVLSGYEDGSFRPNKPVSRVEAVVAAVRLMGLEEEAQSKSTDSKLAFTDAEAIDKKYNWAKGYIIVALEQGLFETSESKLDPQKPASRIWVSALLVKALGLEDEALALMTDVPDFKDVSAIPAGSIGYVNIAVQKGIVTGYPDETFKPNKNVTRAELAALLVRTNDNLLEQAGAVTVSGEITAISFDVEQGEAAASEDIAVTEENAGSEEAVTPEENTVTEEGITAEESVPTEEDAASDTSTLGTIALKSFNSSTLTYQISAMLPVTYEDQFTPASELVTGDYVSLTVEDGIAVNASLVDKDEVNEATAGLHELKVELELDKDNGLKLEYENKKGETTAKIELKFDGEKVKLSGDEAVQEVEAILEALKLTPELSEEEMADQLLAELEMQDMLYKSFKVEVKFSNGTKLEFESKLEEESKKDAEDKQEGRGDKEGRTEGGKKR